MMKKLLYGLVCCCSLAYGQNQDTSDVLMLNDDWSFSQVGTENGCQLLFRAQFIRI